MKLARNLLYGVIAYEMGYLTAEQLEQACEFLWDPQECTLPEVLLEEGWISRGHLQEMERIVEAVLDEKDQDDSAALAVASGDEIRKRLGRLSDVEMRDVLDALGPPPSKSFAEFIAELVSRETRIDVPQGSTLRRTDAVDTLSNVALSSPQEYALVESLDKPQDIGGRYTIKALLGKGGLGRVWLAHDADLNREVALKELRPDTQSWNDSIERLMKEAQVTGQLEHPNIVPVYELVQDGVGHRPYYTMRMIRGQTLKQAIAGLRELPPRSQAYQLELRRLLTAFVSVCQAIAYAHTRGVLHRDLKPEHVVLGDFGEVLVVDWGIARIVGERIAEQHAVEEPMPAANVTVSQDLGEFPTLQGSIMGTPGFMAPEQAKGDLDQLDPKTDIYGLGAILYCILSGQAPYQGDTVMEILSKLGMDEDPPRVREANPHVPKALDAICSKAMASRKDDRYGTAIELADDVDRWLADEPVSACPDSLPTRVVRWMRKHRSWTAAGAAALLAVAVLSTITLVVVRNAHLQTTDALTKEAVARETAERLKGIAETERDAAQQARQNEARQRDRAEQSLYFTRIALAERALRSGDADSAQTLLEKCVPATGEPDLRGWEWRYLRQVSSAQLRTMAGHTGPVFAARFSPDGKTVVSCGGGNLFFQNPGQQVRPGEIVIWDVESGEKLALIRGHEHLITALAYSPGGKIIASGSHDGTVKLWNLASGKFEIGFRGKGKITDVRFDRDGSRLAFLDEQGVNVIDLSAAQRMQTFAAQGVAFLPRDRVALIAGEGDATEVLLRSFDRDAAGKTLAQVPQLNELRYNAEKNLLAAAAGQMIYVWDLDQPGSKPLKLSGHKRRVRSIAFSPDGKKLASGSSDQSVRLWDTQTGREEALLLGHRDDVVFTVAFNHDGRRLVSGGADGTLRIWDATRDPRAFRVPTKSGARLADLAFEGASENLVVVKWGGLIREYDPRQGQIGEVTVAATKHPEWPRSDFAFNPHGTRLAAVSEDRQAAKVWDRATGQEICTLSGETGTITSLCWSRAANRVAGAIAQRTQERVRFALRVWDAEKGTVLCEIHPPEGNVTAVALNSTGTRLCAAVDGAICVWNVATGGKVARMPGGVFVTQLSYDPAEGRLAAADYQANEIKVWTVPDYEPAYALPAPRAVSGVAFSPDGSRLAAVGYDGDVHLWDAATGFDILILETTAGHVGTLGFTPRLAFSPDGTRIAANAFNGLVSIWDAPR